MSRRIWEETAVQTCSATSNRWRRVGNIALAFVLGVAAACVLIVWATPCEEGALCGFLAALHPDALGRFARRLLIRARMTQLDLLAYDIAMAGVMSPETDRQLSARMAELQGQLADLSPITNSKDC